MSIEDSLSRLADAAEIIAAHLSGADAPRTPGTSSAAGANTTTKDKAPTAAEKKAAKEKADRVKKDEKPAEDDPFGTDDGKKPKGKIEEADVREKLAKVIEQDGKAAAFEIMKDKGGGAKNFTELKPEHYEDVYTECVERLG